MVDTHLFQLNAAIFTQHAPPIDTDAHLPPKVLVSFDLFSRCVTRIVFLVKVCQSSEVCRQCQKSVYMAKEVKADGSSFHN